MTEAVHGVSFPGRVLVAYDRRIIGDYRPCGKEIHGLRGNAPEPPGDPNPIDSGPRNR
jgi:hypothetical protein